MPKPLPWLLVTLLFCACGDEPADDDSAAADDDDTTSSSYEVPLDPDSPWPKFRRNARQDGRGTVVPTLGEDVPWVFQTGKGIFSTPVIDGDGTIYVGSADRRMYALSGDGEELWSYETGEIIDSSGLLDDQGRLYFGSGDGFVRALDAATGTLIWEFEADDPSVNDAYINWLEGNVAIGVDGDLYVPCDNWFVYALDRDDGSVVWRFTTPDQTWSLPAVDPGSGELYMGNNNLLELLGDNLFNIMPDGEQGWAAFSAGTIAASPLLTEDGQVLVGGFDGYLRAYAASNGVLQWTFGARDHIYASPAQLSDGTIIQPAADGTIYALDPTDGTLRWAYDTREPVRSSPAVDGEDNIYVGSGEGRLYVLDPDGTLRWARQLITDDRNDLNASPALGNTRIVIAGESGEIFGVPYDWCLSDAAADDDSCVAGPDEDLPSDGAFLLYTTPFGAALDEAPSEVEANAALAFSLFVREAGDTVLAHLDSDSVEVTVEPSAEIAFSVSGDRRFLSVEPLGHFVADGEGQASIRVQGQYLVNPDREGLAFSGGEVGGTFDETFTFELATGDAGALPLPIPAGPGDDAGVWTLTRLAAPLPAILPSYNQIGFDSLHYLVGLVEGDGETGVAWVVGALPSDDDVVADPDTATVFPLSVHWEDGLITLAATDGLALEVMNVTLSFGAFRVSAQLGDDGGAVGAPRVHVSALCSEIDFYGAFLQMLGLCNPQTDALEAYGTVLLEPSGDGVQAAPGGAGTAAFATDGATFTAALDGATLSPEDHRFALLLVDATSGTPLNVDYAADTTWETDGSGHVTAVTLTPATPVTSGLEVRTYLMVDTYPAGVDTLTVP
jgi:outer membrane protein assembly factor BamB